MLVLIERKGTEEECWKALGFEILEEILLWSATYCGITAVGEEDCRSVVWVIRCDPKLCPPGLACAAQPVPSPAWPWSSTLAALWGPSFTPDIRYIFYIKCHIIKMPFRTPFVKLQIHSRIPVVLMEQLKGFPEELLCFRFVTGALTGLSHPWPPCALHGLKEISSLWFIP